jgi:carboxyl-terminal processing protease
MGIAAIIRASGSLWAARRAAPALIALAGALGCSDPETGPEEVVPPEAPPVDCSVPAKKQRLVSLMNDVYLWYKEIPVVDPAAYDSPEALLDALVFKDIDKWSHLSPKEESDAYYVEGRRIGLGIRMKYDVDDSVRIALVYPGSPADNAKMVRGDRILTINDKTIAEIEAGELWETILGPDVDGVVTKMQIERLGGDTADLTMTKREFTFATTHTSRIFPAGDRVVGYLLFDRFLGISIKELDEVFASFKAGGVNELVLDLRYNGGGLIDVALHLGNLIGGDPAEGKLFSSIVHNDKHAGWNRKQIFAAAEGALDLKRIFIIATGSTASSSELLINGLFPHMDVTLIGDTTYGKPVGSGAWTDCDIVIRPISFRMLNDAGRGDFYDGIPPTCRAKDDLALPFGDETEASLAEALHVMRYGACSLSASAPPLDPSMDGAKRRIPLRGFREELGAF